jgi:hypothetical protein
MSQQREQLVREPIPEGQTFCGVIYGYKIVRPAGPRAYEMHVPPIALFTDTLVFGGIPPLSHRLAQAAAMLSPLVTHIDGADYLTEAVLKKDWEAMDEAIKRVVFEYGRPHVRSADVLAALPHGYAVPNEDFTLVTLSKPKGLIVRRVDVRLVERSGKRRYRRYHASLGDSLEWMLTLAFGDRLKVEH